VSTASSRIEVASIPRKSLLSIGQVLAKLTPEFPELSPSKLRFLEDRDLIAPGRTPAGYRTYSSDDVERLRFVLTVQRDQYLPLKVIKAYLDDRDAGTNPSLPITGSIAVSVVTDDQSRYTRAELIDASGASASLLEGAITAGLIEPKKVFAGADLVVVNSIVEASSFGLEPRHLRGMRLAVDREVGLISQAVNAANGKARAMSPSEFRDKGRELSGILTTLRSVLTHDALNRLES
jgi:DNA-binding transcriptional MerR regulator